MQQHTKSPATLIGTVAGIAFYECPRHGDEAPLLVMGKDGKLVPAPFWELPEVWELVELWAE